MNLMSVDVLSNFSRVLRSLIIETRPSKIIETGTYLGKGTTTVIASTIRDFSIIPAKFCSIEVNPNYYRSAYINLRNAGLLNYVDLYWGLSIFKKQLPSVKEIKEKFVDKKWPEGVYIDHNQEIRVDKYFEETDFPNVPEGLLFDCLKKFDYKPDLVLLDSGGHVGEIEWIMLISSLKKSCIIALDDIYHVKHYNSFQQIVSDSRFEILHASSEKFGFCISRFNAMT